MSETIVALATPKGESALATIRVSGDLSKEFMNHCFCIPHPTPRNCYLAHFRDARGEKIDEVIVAYFEKGKSFTGEEMLEISCHGNLLIIETIIRDLISRGGVNASPGEFTKRAFLSGKIDLIQAESIAEIIAAQNFDDVILARKNLAGNLSSIIKDLQNKIIRIQAFVEAFIDFPEDDIGSQSYDSINILLRDCKKVTERLIEGFERRSHLKSKFKVLLIGEPNAGKSTLFNALIGYDRAIVSESPGTTRDYISKDLNLGKFLIELIDTAGIRDTPVSTESMGVSNSLNLIRESDLILFVFDSTLPYPAEMMSECYQNVSGQSVIMVKNKQDLKSNVNSYPFPKNSAIIEISAKNHKGIEELVSSIITVLNKSKTTNTDLDVLVNLRHKNCLEHILLSLNNACELLSDSEDDLLIIDELKSALLELNQMVSPTDNESMLDSLFANFCIGK